MSRYYIDVTGTMAAPFITGIQRTVKELSKRIDAEKEVVLLNHIANSQAYEIITIEQLLSSDKNAQYSNKQIVLLDEIQKNDVFVDLDSVWNFYEERRYLLYPQIKNKGAKIVTLVYDILPIMHPQFFPDDTLWHFILYFSSVIEYTDIIIVNSQATKRAIENIIAKKKMSPKIIKVLPLGADFQERETGNDSIDDSLLKAIQKPYLLMLGTIEPRKNHKLLLDAFDSGLDRLPLNIIIAGRIGWQVEELIKRINNHPLLGKRVFLIERPTDKEVSVLYQNAYGLVFASYGEGFGLPLIEALHYHKLVFASDIEVFREIGKDCCYYFNPDNPESLIRVVADSIANPQTAEKHLERINHYHITSWDEASEQWIALLDQQEEKQRLKTSLPVEYFRTPIQLYMISARMDDILETLPFYEHFMPFIRKVVIGCPQSTAEQIQKTYTGPFPITYLSDEELLNGREMPSDHQIRNTLLRSLAMDRPELDDVFIMADDDNRPLCTIPEKYYLCNGKMNLYYCCEDIREWQPSIGEQTSYDKGMKKTTAFLENAGLSLKQFSSHAPQIICKKVFQEALIRYPEVYNSAIDEWSFYCNFAITNYPDSFVSLPFTTMCWPALTTDWVVKQPPQLYMFENFYRTLYEKGQIFEGFSTSYHPAIVEENLRKIQLRLAEQHKYDVGRYVEKVSDHLYFLTYHEDPVWEINIDDMQITMPRILMGKQGFVQKAPFRITNENRRAKRLKIEGFFYDKERNMTYGFQSEDLDITEMNGEYELPIHYPNSEFTGNLHITFTLDDQNSVFDEVQVRTF